jgi:hypothetical protein
MVLGRHVNASKTKGDKKKKEKKKENSNHLGLRRKF